MPYSKEEESIWHYDQDMVGDEYHHRMVVAMGALPLHTSYCTVLFQKPSSVVAWPRSTIAKALTVKCKVEI